jgi:hypothetical protein
MVVKAQFSCLFDVTRRKSRQKYINLGTLNLCTCIDGSVTDWLHGVRLAAPDEQTRAAMDEESITDAERLRVVHLLITCPERDGGAGVTPGLDGWTYVESIFPLHDTKFNRVYFFINVPDLGMDPKLVSKVVCRRY